MDFSMLSQISEHIPVGIAVFDMDGRLQLCNSAWAGIITRYRSPDFVDISPGAHIISLVPELESAGELLREKIASGETFKHQTLCFVKNGTVYTWDATTTPLREDGKITGFITIHQEKSAPVGQNDLLDGAAKIIGEHTIELQRRERIADGMRGILSIINSNKPLDEVLDYIVKQASQLLGADAVAIYRLYKDVMLRIQASHGIDKDYVSGVQIPVGEAAVGRVVLTKQPMVIPDMAKVIPEMVKTAKQRNDPAMSAFIDGVKKLTEQYRSLLAVPLIVRDEPYGSIVLYYCEPLEHSNEDIELAVTFGAQAALAIENTSLHAQLKEAAVIAERSRLARDLHDAVTQTLFSASLIAEVLPRIWDKDPSEGRKHLDELRNLTRGALAEMRTLLLELRPAALLETDIGDLLRHLAEATVGRAGTKVDLNIDGYHEFQADLQIGLYRITQEALNNIVKHAQASTVALSLNMSPEAVEISIVDNGCGFDPALTSPDSLGLRIMRERAETVGAKISINSQPGNGTTINVLWEPNERSTP
jgi:two-component system nitrate/nitrite sensor histidine kinase NarX